MAQFNPQQKQAIAHRDGPCIVVAGPGSGKTTVVANRVSTLIDSGVDPSRILLLTFTKKASEEMKDRIMKLNEMAAYTTVGTFHSVGYQLMQMYGPDKWPHLFYGGNISLMTEGQYSMCIGKAYRRAVDANPDLDIFGKFDDPDEANVYVDVDNTAEGVMRLSDFLRTQISDWKGRLIGVDDAPFAAGYYILGGGSQFDWNITSERPEDVKQATLTRSSRFTQFICDWYKFTEEEKQQLRVISFDDMLTMWHELLLDERYSASIKNTWQYVIVDETQDNNFAQFALCRLMAEDHKNIFVVGDDDQAIYSFRGARPDEFLNFGEHWDDVVRIDLSDNYRCSSEVVNTANALISLNETRFAKDLRPSSGYSHDESLLLGAYSDEKTEATAVVAEIQRLASSGVDPEDMAVIYRYNANSLPIEFALLMANVPYRCTGTPFWHRREIKNTLAYCTLACPTSTPSAKAEAVARIYNAPKRYLGRAFWALVEPDPMNLIFDDTVFDRKMIRGVRDLRDAIRDAERIGGAGGGDLSRTIITLLDAVGYAKSRDLNMENPPSRDSELSTFSLRLLSAFIEAMDNRFASLSDMLGFLTRADEFYDSEAPKVTLTTAHRAKGLEWPYVFNVSTGFGFDRALWAYLDYEDDEDVSAHAKNYLEEERRVMYVALTRSKLRTYISVAPNLGTDALISFDGIVPWSTPASLRESGQKFRTTLPSGVGKDVKELQDKTVTALGFPVMGEDD